MAQSTLPSHIKQLVDKKNYVIAIKTHAQEQGISLDEAKQQIDAERQANAGDFVIAMVDHESQATFKRYKPCGYDEKLGREYCQLVPLNDFYPTIDSRAVHINIIGVVVKHERKLV